MSELRCATVARDEGLDPLGTAGHYRGFVLVEWPLPWPPDLAEVPALGPLVAALAGTGLRLQGVVPTERDERRVVLYRRPVGSADAGFVCYERIERRVAPDGVVDAAVELVGGEATPPADPAGGGGRGEVLICTHGRRDACCGRHGTALVMQMATDAAIAGAGYRVARTSHTGGHRFAPTAIVLPEGTMWAFLDAELLARIVLRQGEVAAVLGHYRGSTAIGSPGLQAVERAAFAEVGWEWLEWRRWGEELADGRVRVVGEGPDGTRRAWTAEVTDRAKPVPVCGQPLAAAVKQQHEPVVVSLETTPA
ncbi:MAG TPA: sucrase ferredoxin [Acidimicrobiales bacterium]